MRTQRLRKQRYRAAERELMVVLSTSLQGEQSGSNSGECPSRKELQRFAAGKSNAVQCDELLIHLASCDPCINSMTRIRRQRFMLTIARSFLSVIVISAAIWFWRSQQSVSPDLNRVAYLDLRNVSPTRSQITGAQTAMIPKVSGGIRIVLPIGSEGNYEGEILGENGQSIFLRASANTSLDGQAVVLTLRLNFANLKNGKYLLALRRRDSKWEYYSLTLD